MFSMKNKRNVGVSFREEKKESKYIGIYFIHTLGIERDLLWKKISYNFFIGEVKNPCRRRHRCGFSGCAHLLHISLCTVSVESLASSHRAGPVPVRLAMSSLSEGPH